MGYTDNVEGGQTDQLRVHISWHYNYSAGNKYSIDLSYFGFIEVALMNGKHLALKYIW